MTKYIAYYRVSTQKQGESGLGLEAQQAAVNTYVETNAGMLLETFQEVESGKRKNRPELNKAIQACKKQKATLVVAKLDRLARNVAFISSLMESKVDFIACDQPHANKFTIHILAAVAEFEREMISKRTKEGLKAAKRRGVKLGVHGKEVLSKRNRADANDFARKMIPVINRLRSQGYKTIMALTEEMNKRGIDTYTGSGKWHISSTHKLLNRIEMLN